MFSVRVAKQAVAAMTVCSFPTSPVASCSSSSTQSLAACRPWRISCRSFRSVLRRCWRQVEVASLARWVILPHWTVAAALQCHLSPALGVYAMITLA